MEKAANANILIVFKHEDCKECRTGITQLAKLAGQNMETQGPDVGIVDCSKGGESMCEVFVHRTDKDMTNRPYTLLIQNRKVFKYNGPLQAEKI